MAFQLNARDRLDIGVDVMRVALPKGVTLSSFIDILSDQVRPLFLTPLDFSFLLHHTQGLTLTLHMYFSEHLHCRASNLLPGFDASHRTHWIYIHSSAHWS